MGSLQWWLLLARVLPHQQGVPQSPDWELSEKDRPPLTGMSFLELLFASALEKRFIHHVPPRNSINLTVSAEEPIIPKKGNVNPCSSKACSCTRDQPRLVYRAGERGGETDCLFAAVPVSAPQAAPHLLCLFSSPSWPSCCFSLLFYD